MITSQNKYFSNLTLGIFPFLFHVHVYNTNIFKKKFNM